MNIHMLNSNKLIATSVVVAGLSVASIAIVSSASGSPTARPNVTALTAGATASLPASVSEGLQSSDAADRGADASNARAITTPFGTWYLAPTTDGACLVTEDAAVTCASTQNINTGSFVTIELAGASGIGKSLRPSGQATLRGIAPDGITKAVVVDASGNQLGSAAVSTNAYRITIDGLSPGVVIQLLDSSGSAISSIGL